MSGNNYLRKLNGEDSGPREAGQLVAGHHRIVASSYLEVTIVMEQSAEFFEANLEQF